MPAQAINPSCNFILCNTEENTVKERLYVDLLLEKRVDGLLIAPAGGNAEHLRRLVEAAKTPIVCVDRSLPGLGCDTVVVNNRDAAARMVSHLIGLGHRRIVVLKAKLDADSIRQRVEGYRDALQQAGLEVRHDGIMECRSTIQDARSASLAMLHGASLPDAVFTTNNFTTLGLMKAITESGLRCPEDLAVAGFDDFPWALGFRPQLTAVAQPSYLIGKEAVALLFDRLSKKRTGPAVTITMSTELMIRESCGSRQRHLHLVEDPIPERREADG